MEYLEIISLTCHLMHFKVGGRDPLFLAVSSPPLAFRPGLRLTPTLVKPPGAQLSRVQVRAEPTPP